MKDTKTINFFLFFYQLLNSDRGSAAEHVLHFKCHRKYCNGSASENTDLVIFCDTCLQWDSHYNIF